VLTAASLRKQQEDFPNPHLSALKWENKNCRKQQAASISSSSFFFSGSLHISVVEASQCYFYFIRHILETVP
jgi:hypothetical protein